MIKTRSLFLLAFSITLSSCATLFGGRTYVADVVVPGYQEARIYVDDKIVGTGSATFEYKRKKRLKVIVEKSGCDPHSEIFPIDTRPLLIVGDLVGLVGLAVDFGTGAIYRPDFHIDPQVEKIHYDRYRYTIFYDGCKTMK